MLYLIEENFFREVNYNKLIDTIIKLELPYHIVKVFPYIDTVVDLKDIPHIPYEATELPSVEVNVPTFIFGTVKFANIAKSKNWYPASMLNDNHDFQVYKLHYKEHLLNFDSEIIKFGDKISFAGQKFIRPTEDTKTFTGQLFYAAEYEDFVYEKLNSGHRTTLNVETLVQISSPKIIYKEIRCWVVGGKIITASTYKIGTQVIYDDNIEQDALDFAQSMVDIFQLAEAFVIDICLTPFGWKIVECGCINAAGFYNANMQKLIVALENYFEDWYLIKNILFFSL